MSKGITLNCNDLIHWQQTDNLYEKQLGILSGEVEMSVQALARKPQEVRTKVKLIGDLSNEHDKQDNVASNISECCSNENNSTGNMQKDEFSFKSKATNSSNDLVSVAKSPGSEEALKFIEDHCLGIYESLLSNLKDSNTNPQYLTFNLSNFRSTQTCFDPRLKIIKRNNLPLYPKSSYLFPSKKSNRSKNFAIIYHVLRSIHSSVITNTFQTKRDIYYANPDLFKKQARVDNIIEGFANALGLRRSDLNVKETRKGLVYGHCVLELHTGQILDLRENWQLIPDVSSIRKIEVLFDFVVLIEKDASFQTLCSKNFISRAGIGKGIIITGKGYPDINTRAFIKRISGCLRQSRDAYNRTLPLLAVTDYDPHGIAIALNYKYGSKRLARENVHLAVSEIQWLGLSFCDLPKESDEFIELTARDRQLILSMLSDAQVCGDFRIRRELQRMLIQNKKIELQSMRGQDGNSFSDWLAGKLR